VAQEARHRAVSGGTHMLRSRGECFFGKQTTFSKKSTTILYDKSTRYFMLTLVKLQGHDIAERCRLGHALRLRV